MSRKKQPLSSKKIEQLKQQPRKGVRKLTDKQREYVRLMSSGEKMTPTRAVMQAYNMKSPQSAGGYSQVLKKNPVIQSALLAHSNLAEQTIVRAIMDYGESEKQWQRTLAVETSKWVHDKLHGKAVQQNINLNQNFTKHVEDKGKTYDL